MPLRPDVVVVLGGDDGPDQRLVPLGRPRLVVAADSGLHRAQALGLEVAHLIGDLDSVDPDRLAAAEAAGTIVHRHLSDKDETDAELAFRFVAEALRAGDIDVEPGSLPHMVVVAGSTGRLDLLLADLMLLGGPLTEPFDVRAHVGAATVRVARPQRPVEVTGSVGEQVSLLPLHGAASGVATEGLRWPLTEATLVAATSRGVSNELVGERATVTVDDGVLLVVQQGIVAPVRDVRVDDYDPSPRS